MNVYLMRHGIAADADGVTGDDQRPLTDKGRKKLEKIAANMKNLNIEIDLILSSPSLRTRQTAEVILASLNVPNKKLILSENLRMGAALEELIEEINSHMLIENILLVSHEPVLSQLIGILLAGDESLNIQIKKAGLCKLEVRRLICGRCARLDYLLTPDQLASMQVC